MATALELIRVGKSYSAGASTIKAVEDLSFSVEEGEIFGLLGPNGAGKSTSIHMISGLARVGSGQIQVFGKDVTQDFRLTRRWIGLMHQEVVIDNFFTVEETLKIHSGYYGFKDDPKWRNQVVERLSLGQYLKRKPLQLSGGTKRRLMLAKALIHKPKLLILDEPTAGVDVELRQTLWEFVQELNREGATILLTTHYLEEAERLCSRIAIMNRGRLAALDRTDVLLGSVGDLKRLKLEDVYLRLTKGNISS